MNFKNLKTENLIPQFTYEKCKNCNGYGTIGYQKITCPTCEGVGSNKIPLIEKQEKSVNGGNTS